MWCGGETKDSPGRSLRRGLGPPRTAALPPPTLASHLPPRPAPGRPPAGALGGRVLARWSWRGRPAQQGHGDQRPPRPAPQLPLPRPCHPPPSLHPPERVGAAGPCSARWPLSEGSPFIPGRLFSGEAACRAQAPATLGLHGPGNAGPPLRPAVGLGGEAATREGPSADVSRAGLEKTQPLCPHVRVPGPLLPVAASAPRGAGRRVPETGPPGPWAVRPLSSSLCCWSLRLVDPPGLVTAPCPLPTPVGRGLPGLICPQRAGLPGGRKTSHRDVQVPRAGGPQALSRREWPAGGPCDGPKTA